MHMRMHAHAYAHACPSFPPSACVLACGDVERAWLGVGVGVGVGVAGVKKVKVLSLFSLVFTSVGGASSSSPPPHACVLFNTCMYTSYLYI